MKAVEFCYWLQGFFEISDSANAGSIRQIDVKQIEIIKNHLAMVFVHDIDPKQGTPEHQAKLQALHDGLEKLANHPPGDPDKDTIWRC